MSQQLNMFKECFFKYLTNFSFFPPRFLCINKNGLPSIKLIRIQFWKASLGKLPKLPEGETIKIWSIGMDPPIKFQIFIQTPPKISFKHLDPP